MLNKLNLGCGFVCPPFNMNAEDWYNVDKIIYGANIKGDILKGLDFPDGHFAFVLMNHVLQTFTYNEHEQVLAEVRRIMKPGATLRILVPDLALALKAMITHDREYFPISTELESTFDGTAARYIFWHGETRCAFTEQSLNDLLLRNDFSKVRRSKFGDCELDSREKESLIMECIK